MSQQFLEFAVQYHAQLSSRIRGYLHGQGLTDAVIDRYLLGWSGWRITIPIYDRTGDVRFFKLLKDPADTGDAAQLLTAPDSAPELYGWEHVNAAVEQVIVCSDEFSRLILESHGYATVAPTGGPGAFRRNWAAAVSNIPRVFVCLDRDDGLAAEKVGRMVPHSRIVVWPGPVAQRGSVADFFVRLNRPTAAFEDLLACASRTKGTDRRPRRNGRQMPDITRT